MTEGIRQTITLKNGIATVSRDGVDPHTYDLAVADERSSFMADTGIFALGAVSLISIAQRSGEHPLTTIMRDALLDATSAGFVHLQAVPSIVLDALAAFKGEMSFTI